MVKKENLIYERGGQDLSENLHKSIWYELKSQPPKPPEKGVFSRLYEMNSFLVVKIELSMHICTQNDQLNKG